MIPLGKWKYCEMFFSHLDLTFPLFLANFNLFSLDMCTIKLISNGKNYENGVHINFIF